jgi:hypothetical protein
MELTLKITIDATPAVISIIQALTGKVISTDAPASTPAAVKKEAPVKSIAPTPAPKKVVAAPATVETAEVDETTTENEAEVTLETIRELGAAKIQSGKQAAFKKLLAEYGGAKELSKLKPEHYTDFYEKLQQLK